MSSTDKTLTDFRNVYDNFTLEATKLTEMECSLKFDSCMNKVIQTRGKDDGPAANNEDRHKMRLFSFKQLFNMFRTCSNNSEISDRV